MKTIILKPSHRCNLNCWFCYDRHNRSKDSDILPVDKCIIGLRKIMTEQQEMGENSWQIIWHGGEPTLLGVDYVRKVCTTLSKEFNIKWDMQSNASLINKDWARLCDEVGLHIGFSWDGLKAKGKDTHNTEYILNAAKYLNGISVLYVVTPDNCDNVMESYIYARQHSWDPAFNIIFGEGTTKDEFFKIAVNLAILFDYICSQEDAFIPRPFLEALNYVDGSQPVLCESQFCAGRWVGMGSHGEISACGKPWPDSVIWGNIFDENFHLYDLDKNKHFIDFRNNELQQWERCRKCKWLFQCSNSCPFSATKEDGKIYFDEGYCFFKRTFMQLILDILEEKYQNHSLKNVEIIQIMKNSKKTEFVKWKDFRYHTTEI